MKKLFFAFSLMFAAVAANAQQTPATDQPAQTTDQTSPSQNMTEADKSEGEMIPATDLPATVTQQLQGQDYSGWTVGNTWRKEKDGQTYYAVELRQGNEAKKVKFDAQGNVVKEKDKEDQK